MYDHQPVAGINPFITNKGTRYFLIGREIETLKWCGFTGGFEHQKDETLIHTAIRELMEESCNVFLPWKKEVYDKLINTYTISKRRKLNGCPNTISSVKNSEKGLGRT